MSPPPAPPSAVKIPWAHVLTVAGLASIHALWKLGRLHPDEVFQMLEPAVWKLYGYGTRAWEWDPTPPGGIRNWAFPGIVMGCLKLADALGWKDVMARRALIEIPQFLLHVGLLASVFRFSARRVDAKLATACVWLVGLYGPVLWFQGRTVTEALAMPFLVIALERLDAREAGLKAAAFAGVCLGLAQVFRYGSAAAILFALLWLALERRWKDLAAVVAGGAVAAAGLAALDLATWGFLTLPRYLDFNLRSGQAQANFGESPPWWYVLRFLLAPWAAVGLVLWRWDKAARAWGMLFVGVGYLVAISATPHKEGRFLYPTLVLLTIAGTPAFVRWAKEALQKTSPVWKQGVVAVCALGGLAFYVFPCPFEPARPEQFQLTVEAGRTGKGFILVNEGMWGSGGSFYLGKNMPWCHCDWPQDGCFQMAMACHGGPSADPRCPGTFDRAVTWDDRALAELQQAGFKLVEARGPAKLLAR